LLCFTWVIRNPWCPRWLSSKQCQGWCCKVGARVDPKLHPNYSLEVIILMQHGAVLKGWWSTKLLSIYALGCKSSFQNIEGHWDNKWDVSKYCEGGQNEHQKINEMKSIVDISSRQPKLNATIKVLKWQRIPLKE
jgi:hypothetical protein